MTLRVLLSLILLGIFTSCTSEYDECLAEAKELRQRYLMVEETNMVSPNENLIQELQKIENEIDYLAKVSGNEQLFFRELDSY